MLEFKYDYTDCLDLNSVNETCHNQLSANLDYACTCRIYLNEIKFEHRNALNFYYMLENYFQNSRHYVKSVDYSQLSGLKTRANDELSSGCEPVRYKIVNEKKIKYAPCGLIANSLFNGIHSSLLITWKALKLIEIFPFFCTDTFNFFFIEQSTKESVKLNMSKENLAWNTDRNFKYSDPLDKSLYFYFGVSLNVNWFKFNLNEIDYGPSVKPPNWALNISQLENGYKNEDLMVWMRTAAFPTFKKLYGRLLMKDNPHSITNISRYYMQNQISTTTWLDGLYYVDIDYSMYYFTKLSRRVYFKIEFILEYLVDSFHARKLFVISESTWFGGKCTFLAIIYMIFGSLCLISAIVLHILHYYFGNM